MAPHAELPTGITIVFRGDVKVDKTAEGTTVESTDHAALRALETALPGPITFTIFSDILGKVSLNGIESSDVEVPGYVKPEQRG